MPGVRANLSSMDRILSFPISDEQIVARIRRGDEPAFAALVERYSPRLLGYARSVLGGAHHDAEDVVQEALVSALSALRRDDRPIALSAWLHTIVRNRALDQIRRRRNCADLDGLAMVLGDRDADPALVSERRARVDEVLAGLRDLPGRQRAALVLHGLGGESHAAIGRRLHVTEAGSKTLVHRARRGLERRIAAAA